MRNFNSLPLEIWNIILSHAGESVKDARLMAVNKHWYNIFLSATFTDPCVSLDGKCSTYDSIINSPFQPGQWAKAITFQRFKMEDDLTQVKLYALMIHTPHVVHVAYSSDEPIYAQDWSYFYTVLRMANVWNLYRLPKEWYWTSRNIHLIYPIYLKCAEHLKHSLTSLRLIKEVLPMNFDFSFFHRFTALTSLDIKKGILKNVYDLDTLLQHTPQLETLTVDFKGTCFVSDRQRNGDDNGKLMSGVYHNIKTLIFTNFIFQKDNRVSMLYTNFTGLRNIHIQCAQSILALKKPETSKRFFKMLASLFWFKITFSGDTIDIVSDFINENCQHKMHASVFNTTSTSESITLSGVNIGIRQPIRIDYSLYAIHTIRHIFSNLGQNIQQLDFNLLKGQEAVLYMNTLFSNQHENLRSVTFYKFELTRSGIEDDTNTGYTQNITFEECKLSRQALRLFSPRFATLDTVNINGCNFEGSGDVPWLNITMPKTDIRKLCISSDPTFPCNLFDLNSSNNDDDDDKLSNQHNIPSTFPLISITLAEEGGDVTRYYYTRNEETPTVVETTRTQFFLLARDIPFKVLNKIVCVHVKSIRELSLKLTSDRSNDIQMVF
ncbi:uncharacterized protein EV154DRAFT_495194 [Mucor mucedo]|uniref:uncharacterized protein n=1 Tax=Mucor mucedo TaxID=29922 RepID=UPI002220E5B6|nr:uncharacterized protein EV154DRAFT_495194 [Mucor mucedo]KAI7895538.1 hypothetical protein EV154DRAFT_495194 [Mucor mucedo]